MGQFLTKFSFSLSISGGAREVAAGRARTRPSLPPPRIAQPMRRVGERLRVGQIRSGFDRFSGIWSSQILMRGGGCRREWMGLTVAAGFTMSHLNDVCFLCARRVQALRGREEQGNGETGSREPSKNNSLYISIQTSPSGKGAVQG